MFERYTEKARRVIFFPRYEASSFGSAYIETEHLLLGLLREHKGIGRLLPKVDYDSIRQEVAAHTVIKEASPTSVDLPLSDESKRVLAYAAEEADRLSHRHIGTEHLLLGLLREKEHPAAQLLIQRGADLDKLRGAMAGIAGEHRLHTEFPVGRLLSREINERLLIVHGRGHDSESIRDLVSRYREHSWHWIKRPWTPRDLVVHRPTGQISFDLSLAQDAANFEVVKGVWKRDHCAICGWALFQTPEDAAHNSGYSNGREWLCVECYEKFFKGPDWFRSSYSDIT